MIDEKTIKHYANNYNLIDKAGVMLCFAFFCWAESHFKTNVELSWIWKIFKQNGTSSTVQLWDKTSYRECFYGKDLQTSSFLYLLKEIFLVEFKEFSWLLVSRNFFLHSTFTPPCWHPLVGHQMQMINLLLIHNFAIYKFFVNSNPGRDKLINVFHNGRPSSGF